MEQDQGKDRPLRAAFAELGCEKPEWVYCMADKVLEPGSGLDHTDALGFSGGAFRIQSLPRMVVCPSTVSANYGYRPHRVTKDPGTFLQALSRARTLIAEGKFGEYQSGQAAYRNWMELLHADESSEYFKQQEEAHREDHGLAVLNNYCLQSLRHARKAAAPFLRRYKAELIPQAGGEVEQAAICYDGVTALFDGLGNVKWTTQGRLEQAEVMRRAMELEAKALGHIDRALELSRQALVKRQGGKVWIEGVPKIHFSNFQFNFFSSCLAASLQAVGEDGDYGELCFYAGSAFRLRWNPQRWDMGNVDLRFVAKDFQEPLKRVYAVAGYGYEMLLKPDYASETSTGEGVDDPQLWRRKIVQSINRGYPVIALGVIGPAEPCVIAGYDEGGDVLMGWNLFQEDHQGDPEVGFEPNGYFRKKNWYKDTSGIFILGGRQPVLHGTQAYRSAIEWACKIALQPEVRGRLGNPSAFRVWADAMLEDKSFDTSKPDDLKEKLMIHYDACRMVYGRSQVIPLLKRIAGTGTVPNRELELAAATYEEEMKLLEQMHQPFGGFLNPDKPEDVQKFAGEKPRRELADLILRAGEMDAQAVYYMMEGLRKMLKENVATEDGVTRIDGIESFNCGDFPSSPHGNMARIENLVGSRRDYADFVCYSGFAFKTGWHIECCPSAAHPACGYFCLDVQREISDWTQRFYPIHPLHGANADESKDQIMEKANRLVKDSIDRGIPVHYEREEDGMIIGYRDDGKKWLCLHPYYKNGNEAFWYDEADGFAGGDTPPWTLVAWQKPKEPAERADDQELLVDALRRAVDIWQTDKKGDYYCGKVAYGEWMKWLEGVDSGEVKDPKSGMRGNAWCMYVLVDSRRIAAEWLRKKADAMADREAAALLVRAVDEYAKIPAYCLADYKSTWDFARIETQLDDWTKAERQYQIKALEFSMSCDEKAVGYIAQALALLDKNK